MLIAVLAGRAFLVSVADNAYHYGTRLDEPLEAMNLRLPRALETCVLAFNLHGIHHRNPGLAWPDLLGAFLTEGGRSDLGWWHAVARRICGPVPSTSPRLRDDLRGRRGRRPRETVRRCLPGELLLRAGRRLGRGRPRMISRLSRPCRSG
jgi:hypothetical protein